MVSLVGAIVSATPINCVHCFAIIPGAPASAQWLREQADRIDELADARPRGAWKDEWKVDALKRAIVRATNEIAGICSSCTELEESRRNIRQLSAERRAKGGV